MAANIFERATRKKLRFASNRGNVSCEDLWDMSLEDLDTLAIGLRKEIRESEEESFLSNTRGSTDTKLRFNIVKQVIETRLAENEAAAQRAENKAKKNRLLDLIAQKQDQALSEKSIEELQAEIEALGVS